MNFIHPQFSLALPEMILLGMISIILIADLFISDKGRVVTYLMTQATLVLAAIATAAVMGADVALSFNGHFIIDPLASLTKLFIYLVSMVAFAYSRSYLIERDMYRGEYFVLGLTAVLGMMVLASAHSLLTLYLGLELLSLSLYAMVGLRRDSSQAAEAAMKYFVLGAMASAMLLYGMSMIYGATGTLNLWEIRDAVAEGSGHSLVLIFGLVFLMVGVAFKLGAAPFHMWVPDVYHGAPTSVTLFLSSAPKLAAFVLMIRLLVDALPALASAWSDMLVIIAVLSIVLGNVIAIAQLNIKRMLAYSGISHIGFLLLGVLSATPEGYAAAFYYAIVYAIMSLGGFAMVLVMSRQGFEADELSDYAGLNERSPIIALMMLFIMFSMAGVPPLLGFWAKLAVIQAIVAVEYYQLAVLAVLFSVVGAFYYLRVIRIIYFDKPTERRELKPANDLKVIFIANAMLVLLLGLFPESLMNLCQSAFIY
ncbi:MAG: NADH-quinone oxidoreductase subunit NuoN [Gammaproteobacteria bacterium]|nr:NADH-quinone oxidoreductase subunit NuoN [Gammaproteobacteria bacterium]